MPIQIQGVSSLRHPKDAPFYCIMRNQECEQTTITIDSNNADYLLISLTTLNPIFFAAWSSGISERAAERTPLAAVE